MQFWKRYPKNLWILVIGMIINVTGMSFLWPLNTIYINQQLGRSISEAGFILMLHAGAGIFGSLLGGYLYDWIGGKKTVILAVLGSMCCVLLLALQLGWIYYVLLMIVYGFTVGMIFPPMYALAGLSWPEGGRNSFNLMYISQNLGVAIGSALGGVVASYSFTYVFIINGLTYLLFLLMIGYGLGDIRPPLQEPIQKTNYSRTGRLLQTEGAGSLLVLCLGFMMCWISYVQWQTSISTYMHQLGFPLSSYSLLWTINGLLILVAQPISIYFTTHILTSLRGQLMAGGVIFILSLTVLTQTQAYNGFLIGMAIITLGEILIWPAVPSIAANLAPQGKEGFYQGIVNGFATGGRTFGPLVGGVLYDAFGPMVMLLCMILFCGIALVCFLNYERFYLPGYKRKQAA